MRWDTVQILYMQEDKREENDGNNQICQSTDLVIFSTTLLNSSGWSA